MTAIENSPTADALRRVVARDEIRQLVYQYAWRLDSRDIDGLAALFVEDVNLGPGLGGRDELATKFRSQLRELGPTTLLVGNHIIEFDSADNDRASGIVYCRGYIHDPTGFIEQMIVYFDTYQHGADGVWRFVGRRHELFYGVVAAEQPQDLAPANWPSAQTGTGTIPFRLDTWQAFQAD